MPNLFVITGSNGAGKSTVGATYFPEDVGEIFDGDKLYLKKRSELWKSGLKVQKELSKQASEFVEETFKKLIDEAISNRSDFAYEGHFSRDESWLTPEKFRIAGYQLHLVFFGLSSPKISANRVLIRAKEGGHFVDPLTLRDNFYGNLQQLNKRFELFDTLKIIDTSASEHTELILLENGVVTESLANGNFPAWFTEHLTAIDTVLKKNK